jgi:release factor glutamine methyltransferase
MNTLNEVYTEIYNRLKSFTSARVETEVIISKTLNLEKEKIYIYPEKILNRKEIKEIYKNLNLRLSRVPLEYIFHEKEFFGLNFYVDENVLIPRQETEFLVEATIKLLSQCNFKIVADIGTGCGNIAISIIKNISSKIKIYATDISNKALKIAKKNAFLHKVEDKIIFVQTDKLQYFIDNNIVLDIIVSNPPYVTEEEYKNLQPEIYFEPKIALVSPTGLEFYLYFANYSKKVLRENGFLILEINSNLYDKICNIFEKNNFYIYKTIYDYYNLPRVVVVKNNN